MVLVPLLAGAVKGHTRILREKRLAEAEAEKNKAEKREKIGEFIVENADKFKPGTDFQAILNEENLDWKHLIPAVNLVDKIENTLSYGAVTIPKVSYWEDGMKSGDAMKKADAWFNTHVNYIDMNGADALIDELQKNPTQKTRFLEDLVKYEELHNAGDLKERMNPETGATSGFVHANKVYGRLYNAVKPLMDPTSPQATGSTEAVDEQILKTTSSISDPANAVIIKVGADLQPEQLTKMQMEGLNKLVGLNSVYGGRPQKFVDDFQDIIPVRDGEEATIENTHAVLLTAIELANKDYHLLGVEGGGDENMRVSLAKELIRKFGSDRYRMAQAMSLLVSPSEEGAVASDRITYSPEMVNKKFEEITGAKPSEVKSSFQSGSKLQAQLNIVANSVTVAGTTGFAQAIQSLGIKIFGEGGQLDQIFNNNNIASNTLKDDGTSVESLETIARNLGFFDAKKGTALARAEAAKISLAMAMARAADPSGRLSNQDFETQLRKLGSGGVGDTIEQVQAKLRDIAEEFGRDFDRVKIMNNILKPGAKFSRRSIRMLYADATVQEALDIEYAVRGSMTRTEETKQAALPEGMVAVPENFEPADQLELPTADGQGSRTMVFSVGAQGMPQMGWYEQTEQGLIPATEADITAIKESGNM